jgi:HD-GYP domain-containing protein (c-di-GMP phosphodiesterase class II)
VLPAGAHPISPPRHPLIAFSDQHGRGFYAGLLEALVRGMGTAKGYLFTHGPRVALLSIRIGRSFGLSERELAELLFGSILADVGMIGLVEDAWERPVQVLPPESRALVELHPARSAHALRCIPGLEPIEPLVRHHHEWWDGTGYPDRLAGSEIPFGAQILRLADTATALGGRRPQRRSLTRSLVRREIESGIGREFSPEVGRRYLDLLDARAIDTFSPILYRHERLRAVDHLLPADAALSPDNLLEILGSLIDAKDTYTGGHSRRVAVLASEVARTMGLGTEVQKSLRVAGHLHDLGKLEIPRGILTRQGPLTPRETKQVESHAAVGARLLEGIPALQHLAPACRHHHERWDGGGYPDGLSGEAIPTMARILTVCDAYDAMTSDRTYGIPVAHDRALVEIEAGLGTHFDPRFGKAFLSLPRGTFERLRPDHLLFSPPFSRPDLPAPGFGPPRPTGTLCATGRRVRSG